MNIRYDTMGISQLIKGRNLSLKKKSNFATELACSFNVTARPALITEWSREFLLTARCLVPLPGSNSDWSCNIVALGLLLYCIVFFIDRIIHGTKLQTQII